MFKLIVVAVLIFAGYSQFSSKPEAKDDKSLEAAQRELVAESEKTEALAPKAKTPMEGMIAAGKKVTIDTVALKDKLTKAKYQFGRINSRAEQSALHSQFIAASREYFRNTLYLKRYNDLNEREAQMFAKLKAHMNKSGAEIDELVYSLHVASAAAKTRAYNRECKKRA